MPDSAPRLRTTAADPRPGGLDPWCDLRRCGRIFGGVVLAAFVLYGVGSALVPHPTGLLLVGLNSVAVAIAGGIGHRLLRDGERRAGGVYLVARSVEAVLLFGGAALVVMGSDPALDETAYRLAMIVLGVGSLPFLFALRGRWLPGRLALWGVAGYVLLATGAALELATGLPLAVVLAIPGGLFELTLGAYLLVGGFRRPDRPPIDRQGSGSRPSRRGPHARGRPTAPTSRPSVERIPALPSMRPERP